ncbi:MAG: dihydroorotase [Albidovulum sp.]|nr:dihydroorotase [Albidovulum sp.]
MADPRIMPAFEIACPDDWHVHFRDGDVLKAVVPETARSFARALVMPNLLPPVRCDSDAVAYKRRILASVPDEFEFEPLMTLYLTEESEPKLVEAAAVAGTAIAVKLYPAGATTNSASGVRNFDKIAPVLEKMAEIGMPLCVHGEVADEAVDIFDRETVFLERVLEPIRRRNPALKVVLEHVTTREGVEYVLNGGGGIAATITVHHLAINRNIMLSGGMRPHYYCLPVAKRECHREALLSAATSGSERFFLGTDSAPHLKDGKETAVACAGIFTATCAVPCLAQIFDDTGAIDRLEAFASVNGAKFYDLPQNSGKIILEKCELPVEYSKAVSAGDDSIAVFDPGFPIHWKARRCRDKLR